MTIRRAKAIDIDRLIILLQEVLEIHASSRPDVFYSGVTKYTKEELMEMIKDDNNPIYVITDEVEVIGYAFCRTSYPAHTHTMKPAKNLFIDDFCIEEKYRGKHIGKTLFEFLKDEAKRLGYTNILLNVWSCNKDALAFYEKMGLTPRSSIMEYKL